MRKVVAIVQARMQSTRLPGKVLMDICGKPMLQRVVERVEQANGIDHVVVATSHDKADDEIAAFCNGHKYDYYRGSLEDVLDRYYQAAKYAQADVIVRITGDCPLIAPDVIDRVVAMSIDERGRLATNAWPPTYPDGLDVEAFSMAQLANAWWSATASSDREHVTPWMHRNLSCWNVSHRPDLSQYRLCVDEQSDLDLIRAIYSELGDNPRWLDVVELLKRRPDLVALNGHIKRNEGLERSLREDANV